MTNKEIIERAQYILSEYETFTPNDISVLSAAVLIARVLLNESEGK